MHKESATQPGELAGFHERRLGQTVLRTYRKTVDIDEIVPNKEQPRAGGKEDPQLQLQIEANLGIFEHLLVEPHPELPNKFLIVDGERRWTNSQVLVQQGKEKFRQIPIEVIDRTLSTEERLRVWVHIHRQRKEWDSKEKETVAYRLIDIVGRASAASILAISLRELDKLGEVYKLSERFTNLAEPGASITWARELIGIARKLRTQRVEDAVVKKVDRKQITNSKDIRKLRKILRDPVAKHHFLTPEGDIDSAMLRISAPQPVPTMGLSGDLDSLLASIKTLPWTTLEELKDDTKTLEQIKEVEALLANLHRTLISATSEK